MRCGSEGCRALPGFIHLTPSTRVEVEAGKEVDGYRFRFHVRGDVETFTLCAETLEERDAWIRCIIANCAARPPVVPVDQPSPSAAPKFVTVRNAQPACSRLVHCTVRHCAVPQR